jgi:hypothetical protein
LQYKSEQLKIDNRNEHTSIFAAACTAGRKHEFPYYDGTYLCGNVLLYDPSSAEKAEGDHEMERVYPEG